MLQQKAAEAYEGVVFFVQAIIAEGVHNKEFRTDIDAADMASFLIESMEGAIMASRLTGSNDPIKQNMKYTEILLRSYMTE